MLVFLQHSSLLRFLLIPIFTLGSPPNLRLLITIMANFPWAGQARPGGLIVITSWLSKTMVTPHSPIVLNTRVAAICRLSFSWVLLVSNVRLLCIFFLLTSGTSCLMLLTVVNGAHTPSSLFVSTELVASCSPLVMARSEPITLPVETLTRTRSLEFMIQVFGFKRHKFQLNRTSKLFSKWNLLCPEDSTIKEEINYCRSSQ